MKKENSELGAKATENSKTHDVIFQQKTKMFEENAILRVDLEKSNSEIVSFQTALEQNSQIITSLQDQFNQAQGLFQYKQKYFKIKIVICVFSSYFGFKGHTPCSYYCSQNKAGKILYFNSPCMGNPFKKS